jgi:hypothetical protein
MPSFAQPCRGGGVQSNLTFAYSGIVSSTGHVSITDGADVRHTFAVFYGTSISTQSPSSS